MFSKEEESLEGWGWGCGGVVLGYGVGVGDGVRMAILGSPMRFDQLSFAKLKDRKADFVATGCFPIPQGGVVPDVPMENNIFLKKVKHLPKR